MEQQRLKESVKNIFPNGVHTDSDEKRLKKFLDRYGVPYTDESINKILKVDLNEAVKEHKKEA